MADPRVASTNRVGSEPQNVQTFKADGSDITFDATQPGGSAVVGRAVMLTTGIGVVRLTGAGSPVLGKLLHVENDGYCAVQIGGVVTLPKGDGTIAVGDKIVGDVVTAARGYIRGAAAPGAAYAEAAADESAVSRHIVLDVTTATAIEVSLDA